MNGMRQTRTIGEWMGLAKEWNEQCQHGNPVDTCATCVGALHPVLSATAIHLQKLLEGKTQGSGANLAKIFTLSVDTDDLFREIRSAFIDLRDVESTPVNGAAAERERRDLAIIAADMDALIARFEEAFPDIREHRISAAVRQTAL